MNSIRPLFTDEAVENSETLTVLDMFITVYATSNRRTILRENGNLKFICESGGEKCHQILLTSASTIAQVENYKEDIDYSMGVK